MMKTAVAVTAAVALVAWAFVTIYLPARRAHGQEIRMATPTAPTRVLLRPGETE